MSFSSQEFECYVPVYDTVPEKWEEARPFLIEVLKKITNGVNAREIGWFLDEELLSGKQFIPPTGISGTSEQNRSVLRKVIDCGALVAGINPGIPHGISFNANSNFSLIDLWVAGTETATLTARNISGNDVVMNTTDLIITSPQAFTRSFCVCEYIQEL